jgi:LysM repeat protein
MSKRVIVISVLAIFAIIYMTSCTLSASNPPQATATAAGNTEVPTGISLVQAWATSTAVYQQTAAALGSVSPTPSPTTANQTQLPPTGAPGVTPVVTTPVIVVVPTSTPGHPASYTLQAGEFPYCIARRFNVNPADLLALNGLTNASSTDLQPGLQLSIPATGSFPGDRVFHAHPTTYTVQLNDTIYKIACYFGDLDPTSIAAANNIALTTPLATGSLLNIP